MTKHNKILFCLPLLLQCAALTAQPSIQWQRTFGGTETEEASDVQQTLDGGYIVVGYTISSNGDVFGNHGGADAWALKLDSLGQIEWKRAYGGTNNESFQAVQQTLEGGYIAAGHAMSNNWDVSGVHGKEDFWVVKLAPNGQIEWQKTLGGSEQDDAWSVKQTADGGYIVAGHTRSNDGDVTGNHGSFDYWVVKLGPQGELEWQRTLGGSSFDLGTTVRQALDGGFVVVGETSSNNGDVTGFMGNTDFWVVKLSAEGELEWQRAIGSTGIDRANDVLVLPDGGYLAVGLLGKGDGHAISGHKGGYDYWAVRLDYLGKVLWERGLGGSNDDFCYAVTQDRDGGFVLTGHTRSVAGDVQGHKGGVDMWMVKIDSKGEFVWQKPLGGSGVDAGYSVKHTTDGGYITAGRSTSSDGDLTQNKGKNDFWIVKLSAEPTSQTATPLATAKLEIWPNPARGHARLQLGSGEPWHQIRAIDAQGRLIWEGRASEAAVLDLSGWQPGVYQVLAVGASGRMAAGRLVKE